jgi:hypothetical protein
MRTTSTTIDSEWAISQLAKGFTMIKNDGFHQYKVRKSMRPPTTDKDNPEANTALVRIAQKNVFNCIIVSPVLIEQCQCHDPSKCSRPFIRKSSSFVVSALTVQS